MSARISSSMNTRTTLNYYRLIVVPSKSRGIFNPASFYSYVQLVYKILSNCMGHYLKVVKILILLRCLLYLAHLEQKRKLWSSSFVCLEETLSNIERVRFCYRSQQTTTGQYFTHRPPSLASPLRPTRLPQLHPTTRPGRRRPHSCTLLPRLSEYPGNRLQFGPL